MSSSDKIGLKTHQNMNLLINSGSLSALQLEAVKYSCQQHADATSITLYWIEKTIRLCFTMTLTIKVTQQVGQGAEGK